MGTIVVVRFHIKLLPAVNWYPHRAWFSKEHVIAGTQVSVKIQEKLYGSMVLKGMKE